MESLLNQVDASVEVVVVDNYSSDGTLAILQQLERLDKIELHLEKCSRGRGRQVAYERSSGEYIIDQVDLDDIYKPVLMPVIELYHRFFEGNVLLLDGLMVATREAIEKVGGWRELQWGEDYEFWFRAAKAGRLRYLNYETRKSVKKHGSGSLIHKLRYKLQRSRDLYRVGLSPWGKAASGAGLKLLNTPFFFAGYVASLFYPSFKDPSIKNFRRRDYLVTLDPIPALFD